MIGNKRTYMSYDVKPSAIETASYVLLAYIQQNDLTNGIPIMKWLMTQLNGKGGFMSTQVNITVKPAHEVTCIKRSPFLFLS